MKKIFTLLLFSAGLLSMSAQYVPFEKGTVLTYQSSTKGEDGKEINLTTTKTLVDVTTSPDGLVNLKFEEVSPIPGNDFAKVTEYGYAIFNPTDSTTTIIVAGEEDSKASVINLLKTSFEAAGQVISQSDLDELDKSIKVKGELKINLKSGIAEGTKIPNQTLRISFGPETMVLNLWEASYGGYESVTVPAGTYDCIKINYVQKTKMGVNSSKTYVTDWYAPGVGLVQSFKSEKKGGEVVSRSELQTVQIP